MMRLAPIPIFLLGLIIAPALAQDGAQTIENKWLKVSLDMATGHFTITPKQSSGTNRIEGQLTAGGGLRQTGKNDMTVNKAVLQNGDEWLVVARRPGEWQDRLTVHKDSPFVWVFSSRRNPDKEPVTIHDVRPVQFDIDLGKPTSEMKTFGTSGLHDPGKSPGSYMWMAVVEPKSRRGVVAGWVTHKKGSGVVFNEKAPDPNRVRLVPVVEYGAARVEPQSHLATEELVIAPFDDVRLGLEAWADAVAQQNHIKLNPQPVGYCTWYSNPNGGASDEKHLAELASFAAKELKPFGFSVVQIDDGWQDGISKNGPRRNFFQHRPDGPYPAGMKATADKIQADGLTAGIWFMPFAGTYYDPFFEKHPDWFVKKADGQPYETDWGGACLDVTNPELREYLRANIERFRDWGYRYFKMDALWTGSATPQQYVNEGYKDDHIGDAVYSDPKVTNIEAFQTGLKLIRETAGSDVFILGCCAPQNMRSYGGAMGWVDAMRIGPDNGSDWNGLKRGPTFGSRHYFLHGRVWYNDPDPVYVRESVPLEQARLICSWVGLTGQLNLSSDWLPGLPKDRLDILKRTMPPHGLLPRPVDLFEHAIPRVWLLTDDKHSPRRDIIGVFNWDDEERVIEESLERIGLEPKTEYVAFDYWKNAAIEPLKEKLSIAVPARSCRILAVRPRVDHPQLISTSRHITQGIVDVIEETWDGATKTLRGRSRVVAGDTYELRIVAPPAWEATGVDVNAGTKTEPRQKGRIIRACVEPTASGEVTWSVRFRTP